MVSTAETVKSQVAGDDSTVEFSTGIVAATTAELGVWITADDGTVTTQVEGVDYTFATSGGLAVVTFASAPASTDTITFLRQTSIAQTLDLTYNERLPSIQIEAAFDRITRMLRDLEAQPVLRFPSSEPAAHTLTLSDAATRAGCLLYFNATTGELEELTIADLQTLLDALP